LERNSKNLASDFCIQLESEKTLRMNLFSLVNCVKIFATTELRNRSQLIINDEGEQKRSGLKKKEASVANNKSSHVFVVDE
jgi:hypothetical protein